MKVLLEGSNIIAPINAMHDWMLDAEKGDTAIYFIGELSRSRLIDEANRVTLNNSADYVWSMMEQGLISLVQKKGEFNEAIKTHKYYYMMQRTGREMMKGKK